MKKILITGGAGFIGSNIAVALREEGQDVVCFDNLSRRGSEILLKRILQYGCSFVHGDIRNQEDFSKLGDSFDVFVECSADPSVLVGTKGDDARYQLNNNLFGTINCFEYARSRMIPLIFLSTSRVYPHTAINRLRFKETETRFEYADHAPGASDKGIAATFPLDGFRSLYGAAKLASEYILKEYSGQYKLPSIINRCGVIAGPWQLGKADQGIFTYWLYRHWYSKKLQYIGYGGKGKQVRDLLHIDDLIRLIKSQMRMIERFRGEVFNAGGSVVSNLSLNETTLLCQKITGKKVEILTNLEDRPADIKWYITNNGDTERIFNWKPQKTPQTILEDIFAWLSKNSDTFSNLFGKEI